MDQLDQPMPRDERGASSLARLLDFMFARPWPSYAFVLALQAKVLWGIFEYRDLTTGDTSSYFDNAWLWAHNHAVNILWSPLYTVFYGTVLTMSSNAFTATTAHRVIIVFAASVGVLAVMRRLLDPALALGVACWWAVLPIVFNTLYEVHLFAVLPILLLWIAADRANRPAFRGIVLALLACTTVLVRNEYIVAASLLAIVYLRQEVIDWRTGRLAGARALTRRVTCYALPAVLAAAICAGFYAHSYVRGASLREAARQKHTLNMCQVYAFGYAQRHPEWTASPWTGCYELMQSTFGTPLPSLSQMIAANPAAVLYHVAWNTTLTPGGLELALFDGTTGGPNPDYAPVEHPHSAWAGVLALVSIIVVITAGWQLRGRQRVWSAWLRARSTLWVAMICVSVVSVPIIATQRPRPSYLFALTITLMAVIGFSIQVITSRWSRTRDAAILAACFAALLFVGPYYRNHPSPRPLRSAYLNLVQLASPSSNVRGVALLGDYASELRSYAHLTGITQTYSYALLQSRPAAQRLTDFLLAHNITVLYVQARILPTIEAAPDGERLLRDPASFGWRSLHGPAGPVQGWALLSRSDPAPIASSAPPRAPDAPADLR